MNKYEHVKKWRKTTKQKIIDSMGGKCQCCGYNKCNDALELHHLDPSEKELTVSSVCANPRSWLKIVNELRKCILLCAVCHREYHAGMTDIPEEYQSFDESFVDYKEKFKEYRNGCPICGELKNYTNRYCSLSCAAKSGNIKNYPEKEGLEDMLKTKTISEISDEFDVSYDSIIKLCNKLKIDYNIKKRIVRPSKNELETLIKTKSVNKLSKDMGISSKTLQKWLKQYEIQERPFASIKK